MIILLTKDMKQYDIIFKNKRKLKRMLRMYCNRLLRQSSRCRSNTYIAITSGKIYIDTSAIYNFDAMLFHVNNKRVGRCSFSVPLMYLSSNGDWSL